MSGKNEEVHFASSVVKFFPFVPEIPIATFGRILILIRLKNGRVERFFGTLKAKLDRLAVDSLEALNCALTEFRFFYGHVRPHQNLASLTPAEAWAGKATFAQPSSREYRFEAWDGLLSGYYLRR
jgi:hypothetical protein